MVVEQMKTLPDALAYEVLDFIGYLKQRNERLENSNMIKAQQTSLANVWADEPEGAWDA